MIVRRAIVDALIAAGAIAAALQIVIEPSLENSATAALALASSLVALVYIRNSRALESQPLSTFAIFGFCMTTQYGALVFQSAAWTPVSASLYSPFYTFGTLALYQAIAIGVHAAFRFFSVSAPERVGTFRRVLTRAGVYATPSSGSLWYMGGVGLISFYLSGLAGVPGKIAHGFNFLAWAPFLIPLYISETGGAYSHARRDTIVLFVYAGIVCLLGLALNQRVVMLIGGATVGLLYLLNGMRSEARVTPMALVRSGALAVLLIALFGPISDLSTAMAIARQARGKIPAAEMIANTLAVWRHPQLIRAYRADQRAAAIYSAYDEYYIANPIVARLVETKFHDNALYFAGTLTSPESKRDLRNMTIDSLWSILPAPLLRVLGVDVRKADLNYSTGDYLVYLSRGIPLGGQKTGSVFAQGIALMGPLFPFLYALLCLGFFAWMDLLTSRGPSGTGTLAALAMMNIWPLFLHGITGDGLHQIFAALLRDFPQMILIYCLVFGFARLLLRSARPGIAVIDARI